MTSKLATLPEGDLIETWDEYYRQADGDTALKDRNFFRLEVEAIRDALMRHASHRCLNIVELGAGTGFLAEFLIDALNLERQADHKYVGVDFSKEAVTKARARNLANAIFVEEDFQAFLDSDQPPIDVLISQRSIMAVIDPAKQRELLKAIKRRLAPDGIAILSEGTRQGADTVNALRRRTGQADFDHVWHCLYVDIDSVSELFQSVSVEDFASMYWIVTRVIYPFGREPEHNTLVHDLAAQLPQVGDYGLVKLIVAQ